MGGGEESAIEVGHLPAGAAKHLCEALGGGDDDDGDDSWEALATLVQDGAGAEGDTPDRAAAALSEAVYRAAKRTGAPAALENEASHALDHACRTLRWLGDDTVVLVEALEEDE